VRQILIKQDLDELSIAAVDQFAQIANRSIVAHGSFSVALAGGSTPGHLYSLLASDNHRLKLDWSRVDFFFGDERHVPPDSEQSNFRMAKETLLDPLGISPARIHRWQSELADANEAAVAYEADLKAYLDRSGRPLDLILLGLGEDAHTASLFPNTAALREIEKLAIANWVEKLNAYRLTITFSTINDASNVIFLVAGRYKSEAVQMVLEGEFRPEDLPAQFVNPEGGDLYWMLDGAAASLLAGE
jgi:6-phosphogluconolactonase